MTAQSTFTTPSLIFRGQQRVELVDWNFPNAPLLPDEVVGRTLVSLISPGTEVNGTFAATRDDPSFSGYAAVMEIEDVGTHVTNFKPGDRAFLMGPHRARQRDHANNLTAIPAGLKPEVAVFARLMGVSWTTLTTTRARPTDRVVVFGLGIIGNLAAQIFAAAGYTVTGIDLDAGRCALAKQSGLKDVRPSLAADDTTVREKAALVIDCTGHEQAVIDACKVVRKGGEVVLVGVPWKKRCDATAFDVLHAVFHRYVTLRSGWEWSLPAQDQDFAIGSTASNLASAMQWLADGRVNTAGLAKLVSPKDAQSVYAELLSLKFLALTAVFDWAKS